MKMNPFFSFRSSDVNKTHIHKSMTYLSLWYETYWIITCLLYSIHLLLKSLQKFRPKPNATRSVCILSQVQWSRGSVSGLWHDASVRLEFCSLRDTQTPNVPKYDINSVFIITSLQAHYADLPASPAGLLGSFAPSGFALCACISLVHVSRFARVSRFALTKIFKKKKCVSID